MRTRSLVLVPLALASVVAVGRMPDLGGVFRPTVLAVPPIRREFRAAWVATVSNIDWPNTRNDVAAARSQMNAILDAAAQLKLNALLLQVRPQCDALYPSALEPWSFYLTGRMDRSPNPPTYDPLQEWIDGARARGIELHAWFNPYRALVQQPGTGDAGHIAPRHVVNSNPSIVVQYGTQRWLDPGNPNAVAHTTNVIMDVVNRYDLDGVVFDDYFYPYQIRDANNNIVDFPDAASYAASGTSLSRADWRRRNVDNFVQGIYQLIKSAKPHVKFGIGPFGIWRPGHPTGVTGLDSFASIYADSRRWINNGWVDYFAPQLYWAINDSGQWYDRLLLWWTQQNLQNRHMFASNAAHNLGGSANWPASEITNQIDVTRSTPGATGNVFFSMRWLQNNTKNIKTILEAGQYAEHALPPAATWLDSGAPLAPIVTYTLNRPFGQHVIGWSQSGPEASRWWVVSTLVGTTWSHRVFPASVTSLQVPVKPAHGATGPLRAFSIAAVDRLGNMSAYTHRVLDATVLSAGGSLRD